MRNALWQQPAERVASLTEAGTNANPKRPDSIFIREFLRTGRTAVLNAPQGGIPLKGA